MGKTLQGRVRLEFVVKDPHIGCFTGQHVKIYDADTGEFLGDRMLSMTMHVGYSNMATAHLNMLVGEDGEPLPAGGKVVVVNADDPEGGDIKNDFFEFLITDIKVVSE